MGEPGRGEVGRGSGVSADGGTLFAGTNIGTSDGPMINALTSAADLVLTRRELLYRTMIVEIRRRYAGSLLGTVWLLLGPLLLMMLYAIIYGVVFQLRPPEL